MIVCTFPKFNGAGDFESLHWLNSFSRRASALPGCNSSAALLINRETLVQSPNLVLCFCDVFRQTRYSMRSFLNLSIFFLKFEFLPSPASLAAITEPRCAQLSHGSNRFRIKEIRDVVPRSWRSAFDSSVQGRSPPSGCLGLGYQVPLAFSRLS